VYLVSARSPHPIVLVRPFIPIICTNLLSFTTQAHILHLDFATSNNYAEQKCRWGRKDSPVRSVIRYVVEDGCHIRFSVALGAIMTMVSQRHLAAEQRRSVRGSARSSVQSAFRRSIYLPLTCLVLAPCSQMFPGFGYSVSSSRSEAITLSTFGFLQVPFTQHIEADQHHNVRSLSRVRSRPHPVPYYTALVSEEPLAAVEAANLARHRRTWREMVLDSACAMAQHL
jgi:hypothetical protein